MDCAYVRVIECGRGLGFAFKAGECLRVAGNFLGQELKGNEAMQSRVLSLWKVESGSPRKVSQI